MGSVTVLLGVLVACGDGGDTVAVESTTSTTADATSSLDTFPDDYCERAQQLSNGGALRLDQNPGRAAAAMETLAAVAPPGLAADYQVVTERLAAVGGVDASDPASALEVLDLLLDSDFLAALDRVERSTFEECGVRLDAGVDDDADD